VHNRGSDVACVYRSVSVLYKYLIVKATIKITVNAISPHLNLGFKE
jgi:hypothetical protein